MIGCVAVLGAGVIGGAIARCLLKSGIVSKVIATRRNVDQLKPLKELGAVITSNNIKAVKDAEVIFICVKPGDVEYLINEVKPEIGGKLVISTAAIISLYFFEQIAPEAKYVRTMPNVAALAQESFTAYCLILCGQILTKTVCCK